MVAKKTTKKKAPSSVKKSTKTPGKGKDARAEKGPKPQGIISGFGTTKKSGVPVPDVRDGPTDTPAARKVGKASKKRKK